MMAPVTSSTTVNCPYFPVVFDLTRDNDDDDDVEDKQNAADQVSYTQHNTPSARQSTRVILQLIC